MNTQEERYSLKVKESIDACLKSHYLNGSKHENVVVMLSGGMDSVSLAWSLLEHTEQNIHIHAIHLDNSEGRFKAEGKAIYDSVKWLKENQRNPSETIKLNKLVNTQRKPVCTIVKMLLESAQANPNIVADFMHEAQVLNELFTQQSFLLKAWFGGPNPYRSSVPASK